MSHFHQALARDTVLVVAAVWTLIAPASAQTPTASLSLDAAIAQAQRVNPTIAAARLKRATDQVGVDVARERPNPEFRADLERETPRYAYSLGLPVETGGKRRRRIELSQATTVVSDAELVRVMVEIRVAVRRAYFSRVEAETRLSLLQELQDLAVRVVAAAQDRFAAGSAPRLEVLQADLARAEAENQAIAAGGTVAAARAQLNALLALPQDAVLSLVTPFDVGPPASRSDLLGRAQSTNVEIAVFDRRLDEQRSRIALAAAMQVPDVTPEAAITRGNEPGFGTGWRVGVSVAVPIFTRHRAGMRLEEAALAQLTAERDATVARITGEATAAVAIANAQREQYLRYRDAIVPQAIAVEQLADDSYRLGRTGIAAYLQALQASREVRLRMVQAAADYQSALAELERTIGVPLP